MIIQLNKDEAQRVNGEYGGRIVSPVQIEDDRFILPIDILLCEFPSDIMELLESKGVVDECIEETEL